MSIQFSDNNTTVHMTNGSISYVMQITDGTYLTHRYFGKAIRKYRESNTYQYFKRGYDTSHNSSIPHLSFDDFPFEYPVAGHGDFRIPAFGITQADGTEFTELSFRKWTILEEQPKIQGLPGTFSEKDKSETLEIICEDMAAGVRVYLYYTMFREIDTIARHQKIENTGNQVVYLNKVNSLSLELPSKQYEWMSLYGTHAKEANINRFPLHHGIQKIESSRGTSSPQHQPFFALLSPETTQTQGNVYSFHFIYSGSFQAEAEVDQFGNVRAQMGLNPDNFRWRLDVGDTFETPEAILNFSRSGLNGMSQNFHRLYTDYLMPQGFARKPRPILLNSWEAMYYDVTLEKIEEQAELAKQVGIELFVLDDGWFRKDNSSYTSMGDWKCNEEKLPGGIKRAAEIIHKKGLQFGLWFEPEMISAQSDLYREHPDWALQVPGYELVEGRHQYVLDLSRTEVQDYVIDVLDSYLNDKNIQYVKWDMNRPLTDVNSLKLSGDSKKEIWHRYVLGLYRILDIVTHRYPEVLFEGCSSGGARFDPGMLYYMPQIWTSDNTDAYDRTDIQSGISLLYPPAAMGAHVSIAPNHQTGRNTSFHTRYQVAKLFNLGYELDLKKCSEIELSEITGEIQEAKGNRITLLQSRFFKHDTPNDNYVMWSMVSEDQTEVHAMIFQKRHNFLTSHALFLLLGLRVDWDYQEKNTKLRYGGDELMEVGLSVPLVKDDFIVFNFHFEKITEEQND